MSCDFLTFLNIQISYELWTVHTYNVYIVFQPKSISKIRKQEWTCMHVLFTLLLSLSLLLFDGSVPCSMRDVTSFQSAVFYNAEFDIECFYLHSLNITIKKLHKFFVFFGVKLVALWFCWFCVCVCVSKIIRKHSVWQGTTQWSLTQIF